MQTGFFCLLSLIAQNLYSQYTGYKYFKNYSYKEYDHAPQNWGIVQDKNGIIYVANHGGVLTFDGVSWRITGTPKYDTVRSMAVDQAGTVFIGGNNKIGFLAPGQGGSLKYTSLLVHLDDKFKNFSNVWKTHATTGGIYFRTQRYLFRWHRGELKVVSENSDYKASFVCNHQLFLQQREKGLIRTVNDSKTFIPGSEIFAEEKIRMMVPYDMDSLSQTLLIGTRLKGFYRYDGRTFTPFPTEVDDYLKKNKFYQGSRKIIHDPSYVLTASGYYPGRVWFGTDKGLVVLSAEKGQMNN